jgi:hypothetical protein
MSRTMLQMRGRSINDYASLTVQARPLSLVEVAEPRWDCRRLFVLSHAAMAVSSSAGGIPPMPSAFSELL